MTTFTIADLAIIASDDLEKFKMIEINPEDTYTFISYLAIAYKHQAYDITKYLIKNPSNEQEYFLSHIYDVMNPHH